MAPHFGSGSKWSPRVIRQTQGPFSILLCVIGIETGTLGKRHANHILPSGSNPNIELTDHDIEDFGELPSSGPDEAEPVVPVATPSELPSSGLVLMKQSLWSL